MSLAQLQSETETAENKAHLSVEPFCLTLSSHGLKLIREKTHTLQINVGFLCNQQCRNCHLSAGPGRTENMNADTANEVVAYAQRCGFDTIDITGGAPELNPNISEIVERLSLLAPRMIFRSNLSALHDGKRGYLLDMLKSHRVVITASFPSLSSSQADSQRGNGIFETSIDALRKLNSLGYGHEGSGLELNLVSNPTGAFLPPSQKETEKRFHRILEKKWGIVFNNLFNFANVPLGRFRQWLFESDNFDRYMKKLSSSFNPCSVDSVMCRTLVSISWDGYLYDCDFNLAAGIFMGKKKTHVSKMSGAPSQGSPISISDYCYTCTAGTGFT